MPDSLEEAGPLHLSPAQILEEITDGFIALDRNWCYAYMNARAGQLVGRDPAEMLGRNVWSQFPETLGGEFHLACERAVQTRRPVLLDDVAYADGRWLELRIHPVAEGLAVFVHDVTDRRLAEQTLRAETRAHSESLALLNTFIETAPVGMAYVDRDLTFRRVNPALAAMGEAPAGELVGRNVADVVPDIDSAAMRGLRRVIEQGVPVTDVQIEGTTAAAPEGRLWVGSYYPVKSETGEVMGAGIIVRDVTEQRRTERLLVERATRDSLTGLPNRTLFLDRLDHATARRRIRQLAVLYIDLDRFKVVNDSLGHAAGDRLLQGVAERISGALRAEDTVARLGGDEFAVLCEAVDDEVEAVRLAERILRALAEPFGTDPPLHIDCSIGIALADPAGTDGASLLRDADTAMYQAKADGRRRLRVFDSRLRDRAVSRHSLEHRLRGALRSGGLEVNYQPVIDLRTRRVVSVEALARWTDPNHGSIAPSDFIPVAEDSGLIHELGSFVLASACAQAAHWEANLPPGTAPRIAVNVSPQQLLRGPTLVDEVEHVLREQALAPSSLCLEITESSVIAETDACTGAIDSLATLGVDLAVDDFGTGYSSLSYLTRLPVSTVKADRSFVSALPEDNGGSQVVRAVIGLARGLGLRTVAEGTELESQVVELTAMGCDQAQGFLFSAAVPARDVEDLLRTSFR